MERPGGGRYSAPRIGHTEQGPSLIISPPGVTPTPRRPVQPFCGEEETMRSLTCTLAALVVAAAALMHFAAHVAERHPRSRFAYGFTTTYDVVEQVNPLTTLCRAATSVTDYALADRTDTSG